MNVTAYDLDEYHGGSWGQVYSGTATSWSASGKANGSYGYRVRACNTAGCSAWSATASETVNETPGAPSDLHLLPGGFKESGEPYTLEWSPVCVPCFL